MSRVFVSPLATPFHSLVPIFPIPSRYISIFRAPPPRYFSPSLSERRFEVHIGNLGLRGAEGKAPPLPAGLFPSIERAIRAEPLDARLHWFRHFFCAFGNQRTVEALFDNQPWEAGMQNLAALDWQDSQGYYSVRNFLMLKPLA